MYFFAQIIFNARISQNIHYLKSKKPDMQLLCGTMTPGVSNAAIPSLPPFTPDRSMLWNNRHEISRSFWSIRH